MITLLAVLLLIVAYEVGYCQGKKSERRNLVSKIELLGGEYVKNIKKLGAK